MKRKYVTKLLISNIIVIFFVSLSTIVTADLSLSTPDNVDDPEDDVIRVDSKVKSWKPTDLHSELDIDTMDRSGQNFNLTFYETIHTGINYQYSLGIFEEFGEEESYSISFTQVWDGYLEGPNGYWTGTGWESLTYNAVSVGNISGNIVEISIPSAALIIQSSYDWGFMAVYIDTTANLTYADICPKNIQDELLKGYSGPSEDAIYGYEPSILIGTTAVFAIISIYFYSKRLKSEF